MRLGISSSLKHKDAKEWAQKMAAIGCKSVVFPLDFTASENEIADYVDAAHDNDLLIAEVGIWKNVFAPNREECEHARTYAVGQLRLAEAIGAKCTVNVSGAFGGAIWDGGYAQNFSKRCWDEIVGYTQKLIDEVHPMKTKYCIEPMPWMYPTNADEYLQLMEDINRAQFQVHLDFVNMINCPRKYFFMDEYMDECFSKWGPYICSCHLKDIILKDDLTFQLEEVPCGKGVLNIEKYCNLASKQDSNIPMIIEHLHTDEEYISSLSYVKNRLEQRKGEEKKDEYRQNP